jgi:hypothetical protein
MDPQYIEQLKAQQVTLAQMLQVQRSAVSTQTSPGLRMTTEIYTQILEDALKTINMIIQYSAIKVLAFATITSLIGLILDRDALPNNLILYVNIFAAFLSFLRIGRCIWVLENIIAIVTKPRNQTRPTSIARNTETVRNTDGLRDPEAEEQT